jgi:hypothetical protein
MSCSASTCREGEARHVSDVDFENHNSTSTYIGGGRESHKELEESLEGDHLVWCYSRLPSRGNDSARRIRSHLFSFGVQTSLLYRPLSLRLGIFEV